MNMLRNRFLNSSAMLLAAPTEGGAEQKPTTMKEDVGAEDDQGAGDATGQGAQQEGGSDDDDGDGKGGPGPGETGEGEDDDPLAGLSEDQRKKVEAKLQKEIGWRDRQIDRLNRQKNAAREDVKALEVIADPARRAAAAPAAGAGKTLTEEDVRREAQRLTAQERYEQSCAETDQAGRRYYGGSDGWNKVTDKLGKMGGVSADDMLSILATDNPAVVIHTLASDPEEYERVMALPQARRNNEFVKLGLKAPPKQASAEPDSKRPGDVKAPPRTISSSNRQAAAQTVNIYDDKVDDDKWYEERNRTRRKKFSNVA